jgi:hypothetical protein
VRPSGKRSAEQDETGEVSAGGSQMESEQNGKSGRDE